MTTLMICASHSPLRHCYAKAPEAWDALQAAYAKMAATVSAFDPQLVIAFGADHFNGFFLNLMPVFCVGTKASAVGDIGGFEGPLDVPDDVAIALVRYLRAQDVDPAVSVDMTVDHGFSQSLHDMLGSIDARPVVPIFINAIAEPLVPFRRTRLLGAATGRFAAATGKRVLLLASGGMSHHPRRYYPEPADASPDVAAWQRSGGSAADSLKPADWIDRLEAMHHEGAAMIVRGERTAEHMRLNEAADRRFLDVLLGASLQAFDDWDPDALVAEAGIGSMELHTWIAAASAHEAAGGGAPALEFYAVTPELGIAAGIVHAGASA